MCSEVVADEGVGVRARNVPEVLGETVAKRVASLANVEDMALNATNGVDTGPRFACCVVEDGMKDPICREGGTLVGQSTSYAARAVALIKPGSPRVREARCDVDTVESTAES